MQRASLLLLAATLLAAGCFPARNAAASGENSPTGVAHALTATEVISSAGSYNAYTGSMVRTIPDLVVPGGVGAYPLAFERTCTSRYVPGTMATVAPLAPAAVGGTPIAGHSTCRAPVSGASTIRTAK